MSYVGQVKKGSTTHLVGSTLYGTCATAAGTAAKVVTCANFDALITGVTIHVKMTNANTVASPTLNVNGTGAKGVRFISGEARGYWLAGEVVSFTYDGTYWLMNDAGIVNYDISSSSQTSSIPSGSSTGVDLNFTIPQSGLFVGALSSYFTANAVGARGARWIKKNSSGTEVSSVQGQLFAAPPNGVGRATVPVVVSVVAGEYFTAEFFQTSGAALNVTFMLYGKVFLNSKQITLT